MLQQIEELINRIVDRFLDRFETIINKKSDPVVQPSPGPITPTQPVTPTPQPTTPSQPPSVPQTPQAGTGFFVPATQLSKYLGTVSDPNTDLLRNKIVTKPTFIWLNGNATDADLVKSILENCGDTIPCFVIYAIPDRDAQQFSAGGFKSIADYNAYVGKIGWVVETTGNKKCVFVVEPDALDILNDKPTTYPCINAAVDILKKNSNTKVFLDGGHPDWVDSKTQAERLKGAGVERADGIAVNVSNYYSTSSCEQYAKDILSNLKSGLQYIIDTSRNGGTTTPGDWCNPNGAKLGQDPQLVDQGQVYAYAWIKIPGESDGSCNGSPVPAGGLWVDRAVDLAK